MEAGFAGPVDGLFGLFEGLDTVDGFLDDGVIILDAEGGAVEADFAEGGDMVFDEAAGVDFDACLDIIDEVIVLVDGFPEAAHMVWGEEGGATAAEVELGDFTLGVDEWFEALHFLVEALDVEVAGVLVTGDDGGTAAEPAE
ncbi:MAG: hypothetical protein RI897_1887 [Verrucomicrobiota bacterium]